LEGSTIEKEDNLDDLDKVFTDDSDMKTGTTSEKTESIDEEKSVETDRSEYDTLKDQSIDTKVSTENPEIEANSKESDSKFFCN